MITKKLFFALVVIVFHLLIMNLTAFGGSLPLTAGNDRKPAIAYNVHAEEYLVVYEHEKAVLNYDIYASIITKNGLVKGPYIIVDSNDSEINPKVVYNIASRQYLVVWERVSSATNHDIYAWRLNADASKDGSALSVATASSLMETNPDVTYNTTNSQYIIVWEQKPLAGGNKDIYARTYKSDGSMAINTFFVARKNYDELSPTVTYDQTNKQYLILWHGQSGTYSSVYRGLVSDNGSIISVLEIDDAGYNLLNPKAVWNPDEKNFLVVMEKHKSSTESSIAGQALDGSGAMMGGFLNIAQGKDQVYGYPNVSYNTVVKEFLVGYTLADSKNGQDLYCRRIDQGGALLGNEVVISTDSGDQLLPAIVPGKDEITFMVWQDERKGKPEIYGEFLSKPIDAVTDPASNITPFSATLNGKATPNGRATICYFEYGTSTSYGSESSFVPIGSGTSQVNVDIDLSGLVPDTTYHFRLVAENDMGSDFGSDRLLYIHNAPPEVVTNLPPQQITTHSAVIRGTITPNNTTTEYWFRYWMDGTDETDADETTHEFIQPGTTAVAVSANLPSLLQNTTYYFRLIATNDGGDVQSDHQTFTTQAEKYGVAGVWPNVIRPWYFNQPRSIKTDSTGNVYIVDTLNHRIQKFSSDGHLLNQWGSPGNGSGEFNVPMGIALDAHGYIYVADTYNKRIQKFTLNGTFITDWMCPANGEGVPFSLSVKSSGEVYVCVSDEAGAEGDRIEVFAESEVNKYNYSGEFVTSDIPGSDPFEFTIKTGALNGEFDGGIEIWQECKPETISPPGGGSTIEMVCTDYLFLTNTLQYQILKFGFNTLKDGVLLAKWGDYGSGDGQFGGGNNKGPSDIAVDKQGQVYVLDSGNYRVQVFTLNNDGSDYVYNRQWGSENNEYAKFVMPEGIAIDASNSVYVTDSESYPVQKFLDNGDFMQRWAGTSTLPGSFKMPEGFCFDNNGNIYVADTGNHRIQKFNQDMEPIGHWYKSGGANADPWFPKDIAISSDDKVYVLSVDTVQVFDLDGNIEAQLHGTGLFPEPGGLSMDGEYLYVTDISLNRIFKYKRLDNWWLEEDWAAEGPTSIAVDSEHNVYVTLTGNKCAIAKYQSDGTPIVVWGVPGSGNGQFSYGMKGITVGSDGFVYVADSYNHRIQIFTKDGHYLNQFSEYGFLPGKLNAVKAIKMRMETVKEEEILALYLTDTLNHRIQRFVILPPDQNNKAIILAGGGIIDNILWQSTKIPADLASWVLSYQGFSSENVRYLSAEQANNPFAGELIDATSHNLQDAIENWALDATSLTLFLSDHGGINDQNEGTFRINEGEILTGDQLNAWLLKLDKPVNVITDACYSGLFSESLVPATGNHRIVISSTGPDEVALFAGQGWLSFSTSFWLNIFNGLSVQKAFEMAQNQIQVIAPEQNPDLLEFDDPGEHTYIGGAITSIGAPEITRVDIANVSGTGADFYIEDNEHYITSKYGISKVWAVAAPETPNFFSLGNPILDFPRINMAWSQNNRWEGKFKNNSLSGKYQIRFYAMDNNGASSSPFQVTLNMNPVNQKKAAIVLGGDTSHNKWAAYKACAELAYLALQVRRYDDGNIEILRPDLPGVYDPPNKTNFQAMISRLKPGASDLVLYMIGPGQQGGFRINDNEVILPSELSDWLGDDLETVVVYDADSSGSFIHDLSHAQRIIVTSTSEIARSQFLSGGEFSFSRSFWIQILNGTNVWESFLNAKNEIQLATNGAQNPRLEDTGDGTCQADDGERAKEFFIGTGMRLAANDPVISAVEAQISSKTISAVVTGTTTLEKVWAVISPPAYVASQEPLLLELYDPDNDGEYKRIYEFAYYGYYKISIFAVEAGPLDKKKTSLVKEMTVFQPEGPDVYEDDDLRSLAKVLFTDGSVQRHNFHDNGDQDWVKFHAKKYYNIPGGDDIDVIYEINFINLEGNAKPEIHIYSESDPGYHFTDFGHVINWNCPVNGVYYMQIINSNSAYGGKTGYDLLMFKPYAGDKGTLDGWVYDDTDPDNLRFLGEGEATVTVSLSNNETDSTDTGSDGYYSMDIPTGTWAVAVNATGFLSPSYESFTIEQGEELRKNFPVTIAGAVIKGDIDDNGDADSGDAQIALEIMTDGKPSGLREDYPESEVDVNQDNKAGLPEVIYALKNPGLYHNDSVGNVRVQGGTATLYNIITLAVTADDASEIAAAALTITYDYDPDELILTSVSSSFFDTITYLPQNLESGKIMISGANDTLKTGSINVEILTLDFSTNGNAAGDYTIQIKPSMITNKEAGYALDDNPEQVPMFLARNLAHDQFNPLAYPELTPAIHPGTIVIDRDGDDDGMDDQWEVDNNLDPEINDAFLDKDGDGYSNLREFLGKSNPDNKDDIPAGFLINIGDDGDIDGHDLFILANELLANCTGPSCSCDFDRNGLVDGIDLRLFIEDFGRN